MKDWKRIGNKIKKTILKLYQKKENCLNLFFYIFSRNVLAILSDLPLTERHVLQLYLKHLYLINNMEDKVIFLGLIKKKIK